MLMKFHTQFTAVFLMVTLFTTVAFAGREDAVPLTLDVLSGPVILYAIMMVFGIVFAVLLVKTLDLIDKIRKVFRL